MIGYSRASAALLILSLAAAPATASPAQKVLRGVGDQAAPAAATAAPEAVLLIDGVEVPGEAYARWLVEEVGPPLMHEFGVGWEIEQQALARGLSADEAQVQAELDEEIGVRVQGAFRGDKAEWVRELARLGRSVDGHRRQRSSELQTGLDAYNLAAEGRVVSEEKILRDWELYHGPRGRSFDLDMLKIPVVVQMPADRPTREDYERARENARAAGQEQALRARERLQQGEDFAKLVAESSTDEATVEAGGRVARFSQFGWPSGFVDALFALERGEISAPLPARGGWWIVRVRDWHDAPLESVRVELTQRLIERGPEQDEVGRVWEQTASGIQIEVQPGMYAADAASDEGPDATALLVNGKPVPRKTVARWLLHTRGESSWAQFTEEWLVERRAAQLGLEISPEDLDANAEAHFQRVLDEGYHGDRAIWRAYQESGGNDPEAWLRQMRRRRRVAYLCEQIMMAERVVTPELVREAYRQHYGETGRVVQARVLLLEIPTPDLAPGLSKEQVDDILQATAEARRRDAVALAERARAGEDFATLVRQHSDDTISRERGGELKGGFRTDGWSSDVRDAVMGLPRGAISEVVQEGRFWAVFEIIDFEEVPFETVAPELEAELREYVPRDIEVAAYRNGLLKESEVELLPGLRE